MRFWQYSRRARICRCEVLHLGELPPLPLTLRRSDLRFLDESWREALRPVSRPRLSTLSYLFNMISTLILVDSNQRQVTSIYQHITLTVLTN